ncbi:MAG: enoyl-CoA hydratase/isomerase family protein [Rhodobacter sp.]|uniref:enoyl-CoA hydratase-related protein n=1 Tax=Pararhodobacter sp. TaxID=2127056 RepID=UPI002C5C8DF9|nr:enoyl-CoA hydratase-related protein [Pararhodobacter sp.]MCC0074071.1 enoyl-CoA hydratase/isomerase family protein [Rhodobacter sp.]HPD93350.1 enoyl-CoA hydratase-related protein [Pararhodobacter sp.]
MNSPDRSLRPQAGPLSGDGAAEDYVQRHTQDGVAILTFAGPEGNRFSPELVTALTRAVVAALGDAGVRALVLTARGADICAGPHADLPPPGPVAAEVPPVLPALSALCTRIEAAAKPTVAALHGRVTSGGLALALACTARVADRRATLAFPEVRLGRLPPGNGAVRLAWLAGAEAALKVCSGASLNAAAAAGLGLLDRVTDGAPVTEALTLAGTLSLSPAPRAAPGLADGPAFRAAVTAARHSLPSPLPQHRQADLWRLEAIEAAQLLPPDQALAFDQIRAEDAARRPEARALAYLNGAARRALSADDVAPLPADITILAALTPDRAARLVPGLLRSGALVTLTAPDRDTLADTLESVAEAQLARVRAGSMTQDQSEQDWQRVAGRLHLDLSARPTVVLTDSAHAAWIAADLAADQPLVLWLDPGEDGPDLPHAARLIPAPTEPPRLCELVADDGAAARIAAALALRLGLTPLRARGGALMAPLLESAARAAGCLRALGVSETTLAATGILPAGLLSGSAAPMPAPPLPLPAERLLLLATVNTAARLLRSGRALRASDIDLCLVLGAGWPNWRGGPMAEADTLGPLVVRHELAQAAALDPDLWQPDPLIETLVRTGQGFASR